MKSFLTIALLVALFGCAKREDPAVAGGGKKGADEAHPEKHVEEANVVELSLEAQKRAGIEVAPIRMRTVQAEVKATGSVQPIDSRIVHLRSLGRARVEQVLVRVGDRVQRGQILARLDSLDAGDLTAQLAPAQADLQRLKIQHANALRQAQRSRSLVEIGAVPAKEAESAEAEARALEEAIRGQQSTIAGIEQRVMRLGGSTAGASSATAIRAPFDGVVITAESATGDVVDSAVAMLSIADLSRVYIDAQVYERDLGKIRVGQPALIAVDAYPSQSFQGRIAAIRDILNPQTRTATVRCEAANADGRLRLEMFANVVIPTTDSHSALALPADAVQTISGRRVVFVRKAELHFEVREVQLLGDGPLAEITAGLQEGEPVVVKGAFQLKSAFLARELESEHGH